MSIIELTSIPATNPARQATVEDAAIYCDEMGLSLHAASPRGWLVKDARSHDREGGLLGCVEEVLEGYELMEIVGGFRWTTFDSLLAATTHLYFRRRGLANTTLLPEPGDERRFDTRIDFDAVLSGGQVSR